MGYSIKLKKHGKSKIAEWATFNDLPHGNTHSLRDSSLKVQEEDLSFGITYNYSWYFYNVLDKKQGIRCIYNRRARDVVKKLSNVRTKLLKMADNEMSKHEIYSPGNDFDEQRILKGDYWYCCAKNAAKALEGLIKLAEIAPDHIFVGD